MYVHTHSAKHFCIFRREECPMWRVIIFASTASMLPHLHALGEASFRTKASHIKYILSFLALTAAVAVDGTKSRALAREPFFIFSECAFHARGPRAPFASPNGRVECKNVPGWLFVYYIIYNVPQQTRRRSYWASEIAQIWTRSSPSAIGLAIMSERDVNCYLMEPALLRIKTSRVRREKFPPWCNCYGWASKKPLPLLIYSTLPNTKSCLALF